MVDVSHPMRRIGFLSMAILTAIRIFAMPLPTVSFNRAGTITDFMVKTKIADISAIKSIIGGAT